MTEAVVGEGFRLGCISCKQREEVSARATVDWHFQPLGEEEFSHVSTSKAFLLLYKDISTCNTYLLLNSIFNKIHSCTFTAKKGKKITEHSCLCCAFSQIFHYDHPIADVLHTNFTNRLEWHGTPDSDVQTATIYIHNITYNDMGSYRCTIHRTLQLPQYDEHITVEKQVELNVVAEGESVFICTFLALCFSSSRT